MVHHRVHRNALYSLIIILAIIQITSLIIITLQLSKMNIELNAKIQKNTNELKYYSKNLIEKYDSVYQQNFRTLSDLVAQQQKDFSQEIKLLKSSREDFSSIAEKAVHSVVTIKTSESIATGFIVHPAGYIVTNYHALAGHEDEINVITYERESFQATLVGKNPQKDIALLAIEGKKFNHLPLADSDKLQVGQKVIAIGNPLGLSFTVTEGIISGLHRSGPSGNPEYIQTDVSLNPGNSGGPLINTQGEVVGIANFKIGGAESLGFALESNSIKKEINDIMKTNII